MMEGWVRLHEMKRQEGKCEHATCRLLSALLSFHSLNEQRSSVINGRPGGGRERRRGRKKEGGRMYANVCETVGREVWRLACHTFLLQMPRGLPLGSVLDRPRGAGGSGCMCEYSPALTAPFPTTLAAVLGGVQRRPWSKVLNTLSLSTGFPLNSRDSRINGSGRRPAEQTRFTHNYCDSPNLKSIQMSACSALLGQRCRANAPEGLLRCCPARVFLAVATSQLCASLWNWEAGEGCLVTKYLACRLFSRFWPSLNTLLWGEWRWIGVVRLSTWKWEEKKDSSTCLIFKYLSHFLHFTASFLPLSFAVKECWRSTWGLRLDSTQIRLPFDLHRVETQKMD